MFAPQSHSGFYRTTIAKCFLAITITCSFVLSMPFARYRSFFTYSLNNIFDDAEIWRLIPSKIAFFDTKNLIFGGLLLYYFRIFERRYGPRKYMSYLICTGTIATILELLTAFCLRYFGFDIKTLPSGPYSTIFPFFVPYYTDIPRVAFTHILGVPVTGKSFPYIMGLQIASSSIESALVCACGIVSGLIYHHNMFRVQSWLVFPASLVLLFDNSLGPYLHSPPPTNLHQPIGATLELQRQDYVERLEHQMRQSQLGARNGLGMFRANWLANGTAHQRPQTTRISNENIQQLVDMGFTHDRVLQALQAGNNDMASATAILLQDSHS